MAGDLTFYGFMPTCRGKVKIEFGKMDQLHFIRYNYRIFSGQYYACGEAGKGLLGEKGAVE